MANNPLEQFEVHPIFELSLFGIDVSFTNASLWMMITLGIMTALTVLPMRGAGMVPGRWQVLSETLYEFVANLVKENVGKDGKAYFPLVFTIFAFILGANMAGMLPYSFTVTSHIIVTATIALFVWVFCTLLGIYKHGLGFLKLFAPSGAPGWLLPLIFVIEVISYVSRPLSLSIRLFANMLAGHIMLKVIAGFIISLGALGGLFSAAAVLPFAFNLFLTALELLVAFLQAYVFAILTCLYLHDALHPGH